MLCDCAVKADEPTKGHRAKNLKGRHEKRLFVQYFCFRIFLFLFWKWTEYWPATCCRFIWWEHKHIINWHHIIIISSIGINYIITISSIGIGQRHFLFSIQKSTGQWVRLIRCGFINKSVASLLLISTISYRLHLQV